ncbi:MAG: S-methyl-5-thioribose-1-phosphate isomerase [Chloroflexi bacterium]|nr:S-methyl-5-thioribose-1-phosphate isomerase [Chloroflexota bacterium]MCI0577606.1 S-methyl-5-thioribose-1-phosphate isomerase [Chloroflexota bacterium]MCI0644174.1 S-methyl-5-thioribose-1-phosphate isomerase [Chloroflexota bacterium]MCI0725243.1 S-methyl-5-thioribose-1-phosphate isomerase [Chloroflexota bacterium]
MRTVFWDYDNHTVKMIDQRLLPFELVIAEFDDYQEVARAIREMVVRGAPAIGATAAFGLALAARQSQATDRLALLRDLETAAEALKAARPTAVNLAWAVARQLRLAASEELETAGDVREALLQAAQKIADDDVKLNRRMGYYGAELIADGDTILHHCNTGALATVDWGTALGVIFAAHEQGKKIHVLVDETRPRLQGALLTTWELQQRGIPFDLIADNAAGHFMRTGQVNIVLVGSDRTAANGDVANKVGTYKLAVVAKENGVPFYPVVPTSTIDLDLANGDLIPIEERSPDEVLRAIDRPIAPPGITARNPAFDVTPHRYVTGIVTEAGIVYPPFEKNLRAAVEKAQKET